jgi:hypothetical protein
LRTAQNKELFDQSRRWGAEIDRLTRQHGPSSGDVVKAQGVQAWRADIAELREAAYDPEAQRNATRGRPPAKDPRFENAPITEAEIAALKEAKTPEAAARLLGAFQTTRVEDARLPRPGSARSLLHEAFDAYELTRLGLTPTARDLEHLADGAAKGQELERTLEFIADRQAQNTRWHLDAPYAARQQEQLSRDQTSSFWYERNLKSAFHERDARTEKAERRTDLQQRREQGEQRREGGPRDSPGQQRDGRDDGGRGR